MMAAGSVRPRGVSWSMICTCDLSGVGRPSNRVSVSSCGASAWQASKVANAMMTAGILLCYKLASLGVLGTRIRRVRLWRDMRWILLAFTSRPIPSRGGNQAIARTKGAEQQVAPGGGLPRNAGKAGGYWRHGGRLLFGVAPDRGSSGRRSTPPRNPNPCLTGWPVIFRRPHRLLRRFARWVRPLREPLPPPLPPGTRCSPAPRAAWKELRASAQK